MSVAVLSSTLDEASEKISYLLKLIGYKPQKSKVMLKPNVVGPSSPESAVATHPVVTGAVIEYFQKLGCEVVIAESSSVAQDTMTSFAKCGYGKLAEKYGVKLIDIDTVKHVPIKWKFGVVMIPQIAFDYEYVNLPKMKTHTAVKVSLGMKNQKGLLLREEKRNFHIKYGLQDAITELQKIISPDLTIVDGILAMEGNGPGISGEPFNMNTLIAGTNVIEVDNVGISLMGFEPGEVEYIPVKTGIDTVGDPIDKLKHSFKRASDNKMSFPNNMTFYHMRNCSGCIERFNIGYYKMRMRDKFVFSKPVDIVSGKDVKILHSDHITACYGNCSKKYAEENSLPFVGGCPPEISDITKMPELIMKKYGEDK